MEKSEPTVARYNSATWHDFTGDQKGTHTPYTPYSWIRNHYMIKSNSTKCVDGTYIMTITVFMTIAESLT